MSMPHLRAPVKVLVRRLGGRLGGDHYRASYDDGRELFDIRLDVSSMLNGSRFYVFTTEDGTLVGEGTFNFGVWNEKEIRRTLEAIVRSKIHGAEVDVAL